jgi:hypothetical protein
MYELGFLSLNWLWPLFVVALIVTLVVATRYRFFLPLALVLYLGVSWNMWAWVPWVFWLAFVASLAAMAWLAWKRTHMTELAVLRTAKIARRASYLALAIPVALLVFTALGAWRRLSVYPQWLTVFLVILLLGIVLWLVFDAIKWLVIVAIALLAIGSVGAILTVSFWSIHDGTSSNRHTATAPKTPTATPTGTGTSTSVSTPTPTPTPTTPAAPKPSGTPTKGATKTKTTAPAKNPVVVRHPASPTPSSPSPHPAPTSSPKPSPTPTRSTSKPAAPKTSPSLFNVTRLSGMDTKGQSPGFCASYSVDTRDRATLTFSASGGHFGPSAFSVSGSGRICVTFYASSTAGNYKLTVKLVDTVTGRNATDVQYVAVSDPPPPPA